MLRYVPRFSRQSLAILLFCLAPPVLSAAPQTATGVVFEDRNGDGVRNAGEPGIPGVAVSNQVDVVLTDAEGRYSLPVEERMILFVTKPANYQTRVDSLNLPLFYYVHKPSGSPPQYYAGVEPTGPLPASVDFPLTPAPVQNSFRVLMLGDPQVETGQEVGYMRDDVLNELSNGAGGALFAVALGDLVFDHLSLFRAYKECIGRVGIPFYNVIGNHDENYDAPNDDLANETFIRHFGPVYYSFDYGQAHFVVLDNLNWQGREADKYIEEFGERQLKWLERDLAVTPREKLIVLLSHAPIIYPQGRTLKDAPRLFEVLRARPRVLAFNAHTHYCFHHFFTAENGWKGEGQFHQVNAATICGSWWGGPKDIRGIPVADQRDGVPNGYTWLDITGTDYTTTFKPASLDANYQMRIYPPSTFGDTRETSRTVLVNVFHGTPTDEVAFSLDGAAPRPMTYRPQNDPVAAALYAGPLDSGKSWVNPTTAYHMWEAQLDEPPKGGYHKITVTHKDLYGREWTQALIFTR